MNPGSGTGGPVPEEAPGAAVRPAPSSAAPSTAEEFGAALGTSAVGPGVQEKSVAGPGEDGPREQGDPEAGPEPSPRRVGAVVGTDRGPSSETEPALDRPGPPVLAGAAIAGLILVAAPFAVVTGTGGAPVALDVMAGGEPAPPALTVQAQGDARSAGQGGSDTGTGSSIPAGGEGDGSPVTDAVPDTGYVPEVQPDLRAPSMPDPGDVSGEPAVQTFDPGREGVPDTEPPTAEGTEDGTGGMSAAEDAGNTADIASADTPDGTAEAPSGDTGAAGGGEEVGSGGTDPAIGTGDGSSDQGGDTAEGAAASTEEGGPGEAVPETFSDAGPAGDGADRSASASSAEDTARNGDPGGPHDQGPPQDPPTADTGDGGDGASSVLGDIAERFGSADGPYLAVAGPGCPATPGSSYGSEGRWGGDEGADGWDTRPGGYEGEGCAGEYDALPVSGDPEQGDGRSTVWSFAPGREGVSCELYVHVPDDESPLWVAEGEARYLIRPGSGTEQPPVAVFGFDQSRVRGGWVQVTGLTTPAEEFTVELTNAGGDPLPDREGSGAHVAASAVRASCP